MSSSEYLLQEFTNLEGFPFHDVLRLLIAFAWMTNGADTHLPISCSVGSESGS